MEQLRQIFSVADLDGDGTLSLDEYARNAQPPAEHACVRHAHAVRTALRLSALMA